MDDYEEYSRMAKLITKIHALKSKESDEVDENENTIFPKAAPKPSKEETKEKFISSIKFQYRQASNRDVSMEEEDKVKGPLQNFSNMMNSNAGNSPRKSGTRDENVCSEETMNVTEVASFAAKSSKVSGASLFGTKTDANVKKPKNKKKKVRRI